MAPGRLLQVVLTVHLTSMCLTKDISDGRFLSDYANSHELQRFSIDDDKAPPGPYRHHDLSFTPNRRKHHCQTKFNVADCSKRNLISVPQNLSTSIVGLDLSENKLNSSALKEGVFSRYKLLKHLYLDSNTISFLPDGAFYGLHNLEYLSLFGNKIKMDSKLNMSMTFMSLQNLKTLNLSKNNDATNSSLIYPDFALSFLQNLENLCMDGLKHHTHFGFGFARLRNLRYLSLSGFTRGNCEMNTLKNDTFRNLVSLKHLDISECKLNSSLIEVDALSHLPSLEIFDVSNNWGLGMDAIGDLMYGLRNNANFRHLRMERITGRFMPCIVIYADNVKWLKNTGLEIIEAQDNEIEMITRGALNHLPRTVKTIDLFHNKIMFGAYYKDLIQLTGLKELNLDGYESRERFPMIFPPSKFKCGKRENSYNDQLLAKSVNSTEDRSPCICGERPPCQIVPQDEMLLPLPPNLEKVSIKTNGIAYTIGKLSFCRNNSLKWVDLSSNVFHRLEGPVRGLKRLESLNLTSTFMQNISRDFFSGFVGLKTLNMSQNLLGECLYRDKRGLVFRRLRNLTALDLSVNNIFKIHNLAFKSLSKLQNLSLASNRLRQTQFKIDHMNDLKLLELQENQINGLTEPMTNHISKLLKTRTVRVDMSHNPISCECGNLRFIRWVVETRVFGDEYKDYYCFYPSTGAKAFVKPVDGYDEILRQLERQCVGHKPIFLAVLACCLLVLVAIVAVLLHRVRWTLRYWYHAAKLRLVSTTQESSQDFLYDVFVSYANEDENFAVHEVQKYLGHERGLNVCLHGEKFKAGAHITDNICYMVRHSRKTLIVVTRNMLKSYWCVYELQMAQQESIATGRNVLVFLFKEELPTKDLGQDILQYIRTNTYVVFPQNERHRKVFWNNLARDLKT